MKRIGEILSAALAVVLSSQGLANAAPSTGLEEMYFSEVPVMSAGFFKTEAKKAPGYSTVVDAQTIENLPIRSLEDLQEQFIPGQYVTNHQSYGPDLGVRGVFDLAKNLYLINGQSVNHRMNFGWAMESRVPLLGDVNRVEFINGPGAIVNGSGATSGMTNIITKNGTENPGFFTKGEYGFTERLKKGEVGYGKSYGEGKDFFLYGGVLKAVGAPVHNIWDWDNSSGGGTWWIGDLDRAYMKSQGYRRPTFKVSSNIRNGNFQTSIFLVDSNSTTNSPQDEYQRWNDIYSSRETTNMHMMSGGIHPQYTLNVTEKESLDLIGSLGVGDYYTEHFPKPDAPTPYNTRINRMGGMESNMEGKIVAKTTRLSRNQIALGGSAGFRRFDDGKSLYHGHDQDWGDQSATGHWKEMSLFAEDVVNPLDALTFSFGARYDRVGYGEVKVYNGLGDTLTGGADPLDTRVEGYAPFTYNPKSQGHLSKRVAASYEITNKTVTRLSYQEGFRYPDMVSFYRVTEWNSILASGGQPVLQAPKPETMQSTEYNLHHDFDKSLSVDANLFYNVIKNQLGWIQYSNYLSGGTVPNGFPLSAINYVANVWLTPWGDTIGWMGATANVSDRTTIRGAELIGNWSPTKSSKVIASYSHAENATETNGNVSKIEGYPRHIIKLAGTDKMCGDKLELGFTYLYASRDKKATNRTGVGRNIYSRDRHLVGINSRYFLLKNLDFQFMVQNLFGTDVPRNTTGTGNDPNDGSLGGDRRFYYAGLQWKI